MGDHLDAGGDRLIEAGEFDALLATVTLPVDAAGRTDFDAINGLTTLNSLTSGYGFG